VGAQFVGAANSQPQPITSKYVAVPGPYSGSTGQGRGITLYVEPGGTSMVNISFPTTQLSCAPSGGIYDQLELLQVAIKPDGSFTSTTSQKGVYSDSSVKFTYGITGRFQAATATTSPSAAGTWREDIAFTSGTTASCTSNVQSWTATLYREPPWQKAVIKPGNYSGSTTSQGRGITFSVEPGGTSMSNISFPTTQLTCTPSGGIYDHFDILQVAIKPDGSFTSTTSQKGVLNGANANYTYIFAGYFEGPTPAGAIAVAGTWRENVVFTSGTTTMCTSNEQSWTATLQS
jgi:enamine deaminase RidA (YjgF/YER057c/UK114 family)